MIDEDKTFREMGYYSTELSFGSHKKVWAICEGENCENVDGRGRWVEFKAYRELCNRCAHKLRRIYDYDENVVRSIDEEKTFAEKGYRSTDLSAQSNKKVWVICIECGCGRWLCFADYTSLCYDCATTSEERRSKIRASRMGEENPNWKGGVSFGKYCAKFNEHFKECVREEFGRVCYVCGMSEESNGKKLCVHHVNYDKSCLCDGVECEFVPLCVSCHTKTNFDRNIWESLIMNVLEYADEVI